MERAHILVIAVVVVSLVLGLLFSPLMVIFGGFGLWILLWVAQGGYMEGNPYKRMHYSQVPDFLEVKDYNRNIVKEVEDRARAQTTIFIFSVGGVMVLIGISWFLGF